MKGPVEEYLTVFHVKMNDACSSNWMTARISSLRPWEFSCAPLLMTPIFTSKKSP